MTALGQKVSQPIPLRPPPEAHGQVTEAEAQAMLRAVLSLFDNSELSRTERLTLLGGVSDRTYQRWRTGEIGPLSKDTVFRLGELLGIHKALRYMFQDVRRAYGWVKRPNDAFGGRSALDLMLQGSVLDISRVRSYLDAERGGW